MQSQSALKYCKLLYKSTILPTAIDSGHSLPCRSHLDIYSVIKPPRPLSHRGRFAGAVALIAPAILPQTAAALSPLAFTPERCAGRMSGKVLSAAFLERCIYRSSPLKSMGQHWDTAGKMPLLWRIAGRFNPFSAASGGKIAAFYRQRYKRLGEKGVLVVHKVCFYLYRFVFFF